MTRLIVAVAIPILLVFIGQSAFAITVVQLKVNTGNSLLDEKINNFYNCISDTHKDPPTLKVTDECFVQNVNQGFISHFVPALGFHFRFHHFAGQPPSFILHSFNHHQEGHHNHD